MSKVNPKQKLLIEYLISSRDTYAICKSIIKPKYFDVELRKVAEFMDKYYDEYHTTPDTKQIAAECNIELEHHQITSDQIKYLTNELERFCRSKAIETAVVESASLMDDENSNAGKIEQLIKDAVSVSLQRDLGLDYFDDPLVRFEKMLQQPPRTPTLLKSLDKGIGGGLARSEIILFAANTGGGKSITLLNLSISMLVQKLNVLYISLELSEDMVAQRFDTAFTGIPTVAWKQNYQEITSSIREYSEHIGKLVIKRLPSGTNSNQIRAYLKEFELMYGYKPDLIVVDYLDLMSPNQKVDMNDVFTKDKLSTEQFRDILFDYNAMGATASQLNRDSIKAAEHDQSHIAGGISKLNTVDWALSIIWNPTMKASGEMGMSFLKARSSDAQGQVFYLKWDNKYLRISNPANEPDDEGNVIKDAFSKSNKNGKQSTKYTTLLDVMNTNNS